MIHWYYKNNDSFSNSFLNVLKSDDALITSGKLFQVLGAWYHQELSPKHVMLTFGTLNDINSFNLSGFVLLFMGL